MNLLLIALVPFIFTNTAEAYIDPATGSMILQAVAAGFFAAIFFFKKFKNQVFEFFKKMFGKK